jgi:hypothetical protein
MRQALRAPGSGRQKEGTPSRFTFNKPDMGVLLVGGPLGPAKAVHVPNLGHGRLARRVNLSSARSEHTRGQPLEWGLEVATLSVYPEHASQSGGQRRKR